MNTQPKQIVTVILLLFVAISVAALIIGETRAPAPRAADGMPTPSEPSADSSEPAQAGTHKVVVYYFHGNVRCRTCRTIETLAHETINAQFQKALANNRLEWRTVNVESAGNEHFVTDYELATRSVVLALFENGRQSRWTNLKRVWELVGRPNDYRAYIADTVREYLETP